MSYLRIRLTEGYAICETYDKERANMEEISLKPRINTNSVTKGKMVRRDGEFLERRGEF